jgi:hypothetical protein
MLVPLGTIIILILVALLELVLLPIVLVIKAAWALLEPPIKEVVTASVKYGSTTGHRLGLLEANEWRAGLVAAESSAGLFGQVRWSLVLPRWPLPYLP